MAGPTRAAGRTARTTSRARGLLTPRTPRSPARRCPAARSPGRRSPPAAGSAAPRAGSSRSRAGRTPRLGSELVRVVRQQLGPVLRDEHEILEPAAAVAAAVEPGLDRDHVALDQLARIAAEPGLLVHLQPDPVSEAVVEAVLEHLAVTLVQPGRVALLVEALAGQHIDVAARDTWPHSFQRQLKHLVDEALVRRQLLGRLPDHERSGHVGVAGRRAVTRPEVQDDRLVRFDLAGSHLVADGRLGPVRDDELVAEEVEAREGLLDGVLHAFTGQRLAVEDERSVLPLGSSKQRARRVHASLRPALGAADALELGLVLGAPALHERLPVGRDLDPLGPELVCQKERERDRDDGARDPELLDGANCGPEPDLFRRNARLHQLVEAELLVRVRLQAVVT